MAAVNEVTAVLLVHNAMDTWTNCCIVITGKRGNSSSACSHCSANTPLCYG